jgi:predicted nucleotidyltransferase
MKLMKTIKEIEKIILSHKEKIIDKYNVKSIGVFGSYVRGEERNKSDIDILVEFNKTTGFFDFLDLENYLKDLLEVQVDLVMKSALKPGIGEYILKEVIYL